METETRRSAAYARDFKDISKPKKLPGEGTGITQRDIDVILQQINSEFRRIVTKIYGRIGQDDFNIITQDYINNKISVDDYTLDQEDIKQRISTNETWIAQNEEEIKLKVSRTEYDETMEEISTSLSQQYDNFTFLFETIQTAMNENQQNTNAEFESIRKFIRLEDGNIILGVEGNELILHIEHNKISYRYNGLEATYFGDKKMVLSNEGSLQRIEMGVEGDDPYFTIYDENGVAQIGLTKKGVQIGDMLLTPFSIGNLTGLAVFV